MECHKLALVLIYVTAVSHFLTSFDIFSLSVSSILLQLELLVLLNKVNANTHTHTPSDQTDSSIRPRCDMIHNIKRVYTNIPGWMPVCWQITPTAHPFSTSDSIWLIISVVQHAVYVLLTVK